MIEYILTTVPDKNQRTGTEHKWKTNLTKLAWKKKKNP